MIELVPLPDEGRRYCVNRRVGLGDVDPSGRVRLDALAAYLQDVATDDADDAQLDDVFGWVVRRVHLEIRRWPRLNEHVRLTTFCAGFGSRWAERRTSITGSRGAAVEAAAVWVAVNEEGRPAPLTKRFHDVYDEAAGGRTVSSRLVLQDAPAGAAVRPWPLRRVDLDVFGHVNNAAHWRPIEELLAGRWPVAATIEFGPALTDDAELRWVEAEGVLRAWLGESSSMQVRLA